ncbi:J domain-containing protein [Streptomyces sp. NPDC046931]|uniref:J domain-containing protein n=1 Tax=Streptomyces sp. NPDC046931 TaxID=3154806 RepID=UPI0033C60C08
MTTPEAEQSESVSGAEEPLAERAGSGGTLGTEGDGTGSGEAAVTGEDSAGSGEAPGTGPDPAGPGEAPGTGEDVGGSAPRPEERLEQAVRAAEQALIEYEIAVETFRVEVENFSRLHHQKLGPMYTRLDELEAEIAEARAALSGDPEDIRRAHEARARVMPMPGVEELFHGWMDSDGLFPEAQAMLTDQPVRPPQRVRPSEEARKLYRDLARKAHPDLAQDEDERKRRDEFIARVNAAYARGDEAQLRELSEEWAAGPVPEERRPSRSEELYARLEWLAQRKDLLTLMARELEESAIGSMLRLAPDDPDTLLNEIAEQLLAQVAEKEAELEALRG